MRFPPTLLELLILLAIGGGTLALAYDFIPASRGAQDGLKDAERDIETGHPRWMLGGKRRAWDANVRTFLQERYGVEAVRLFECCPRPYEGSFARAYNERISGYLIDRFPEFSIDGLVADANREWEQTRSE